MSDLRARLLGVMDQKHHWAYPALTRPGLSRRQLLAHFRHEYLVYVRDFPVLVARALGITPPLHEVRAALAENVYEEQTGRLSHTQAHPQLFLRMMTGLGLEAELFAEDETVLHEAATRYRRFLFEKASEPPWQAAVALLTIFVEGSVNERAELQGSLVRRQAEDVVRDHPLVRHYGCPPDAMDLVRAHALVEGDHRQDAWRAVLAHTPEDSSAARAAAVRCEQALELWHRYRDGVAEHMGLRTDS
ncbi:MAG TPA: iron-containing redox enzyme family protein [Polyangiaceae bacterium]|nr:iron-containing redox enzyme family protein [Polyangiaceae bacterium]